MKRKLESELISIAHRILKIKNKSELAQLQQETLKLYEKISVLRFVEENFSEVKPTIGYTSAEKEVEAVFDKEEKVEVDTFVENELEPLKVIETQEEVVLSAEKVFEEIDSEEEEIEKVLEKEVEILEEVEPEEMLEVNEPAAEKIQDDELVEVAPIVEKIEIDFAPLFEISKEEVSPNGLPKQVTLEDYLSEVHVEPIFVRAEESYSSETTTTQVVTNKEETHTKVEVVEVKKTEFVMDQFESKSVSLNDSLSKTINIGLNDRIGFEKHLFGGSSEDLNRVLSQLSTFSNFTEAQEFIEDMVKPDYNNWIGKEEYATRFMEIIEKKFS